MDRDIFYCQKMQKVASGFVLHIDSYDLHATRFFDTNELESPFHFLLLVVSFSSYVRFFPVYKGRQSRQLIRNRIWVT
jgi:hypothetical protein